MYTYIHTDNKLDFTGFTKVVGGVLLFVYVGSTIVLRATWCTIIGIRVPYFSVRPFLTCVPPDQPLAVKAMHHNLYLRLSDRRRRKVGFDSSHTSLDSLSFSLSMPAFYLGRIFDFRSCVFLLKNCIFFSG